MHKFFVKLSLEKKIWVKIETNLLQTLSIGLSFYLFWCIFYLLVNFVSGQKTTNAVAEWEQFWKLNFSFWFSAQIYKISQKWPISRVNPNLWYDRLQNRKIHLLKKTWDYKLDFGSISFLWRFMLVICNLF